MQEDTIKTQGRDNGILHQDGGSRDGKKWIHLRNVWWTGYGETGKRGCCGVAYSQIDGGGIPCDKKAWKRIRCGEEVGFKHADVLKHKQKDQ